MEEASEGLLAFVLDPMNWVSLEQLRHDAAARPGENPQYQRSVGNLRICASVDITPTLEVYLRVAFRAPGLAPTRAADLLEAFLRPRLPFVPGSEWQVEVDARKWVHFFRRYAAGVLEA